MFRKFNNLLNKNILQIHVSKCHLKDHAYINSITFSSLSHLKDYLLENVIYNKDGVVIIKKPYGIGKGEKKALKDHQSKGLPEGLHYTLTECIKDLQKNLNYDKLEIIKSTERFTEGFFMVCIPEKKELMKRYLLTREEYYSSICLGKLEPKEGIIKLGLTKKTEEDVNFTYTTLVENWSKKSLKRHDVTPGIFDYKVKREGYNNTHLVNIHASTTKSHFLRLLHIFLRTSVIGDNLFGSRLIWLYDHPVYIKPFLASRSPYKLPENILKALDVKAGHEIFIPTHICLNKLEIPKMKFSTNFDFPKYFTFTLERLNLQ